MLDWLLIGTGFTGALTLVFALRSAWRRLGHLHVVASHFSPKGGCTEAIVLEVNKARREVLVQAYSFTSPEITGALIAARKRGVKVEILLDKANEKETYSALGSVEQHGLTVLIDARHAIAHNKIIIIDRRTLLTGSFNFTRQAEHENAENLLVIKGNAMLLANYIHNFTAHREHSQAPGTVVEHAQSVPHAAHWRAA